MVEPSPEPAEEIATHLGQEGHHVAMAGTCRGTLQWIERERPSLVVSELSLPDRDGTELLRRVRLGPRRKQTPVILTSTRDEEVDRVVAFELGADDHVVEPFSLRELALRSGARWTRSVTGPKRSVGSGIAFETASRPPRANAVAETGSHLPRPRRAGVTWMLQNTRTVRRA